MEANIIVPAFNRVAWLRECILSIMQQTFRDFNLIIVDDGSEPPIAEHPLLMGIIDNRRIAVIRKPNGGVASARNLGLDASDSEFVWMLDSDDILEPTALDDMLSVARASRADFIVGASVDFGCGSERGIVVRPQHLYRDPYANCVQQAWPPSSVMVRNDRKTRYKDHREPWEGQEFFLDYLATGRLAAYLDDLVVNMRQHQSSDRLTIRYNHFEPLASGRFYIEKKRELLDMSGTNPDRLAALDARILGYIHSLLRNGRVEDAKSLFSDVSWDLVNRYPWFRTGSFAWCSRRFGFNGAKSFIAVNRLLGRA